MELARHSDMRLTMKTYTDAAQLPLAATVRGLPAFDDSQIDSQTLVADRPAVSPSVIGLKSIKVGKAIENIDESHGLTPTVATCHSEQKGGDLGFESPSLRHFKTLVARWRFRFQAGLEFFPFAWSHHFHVGDVRFS
jgi:hypothetical protein